MPYTEGYDAVNAGAQVMKPTGFAAALLLGWAVLAAHAPLRAQANDACAGRGLPPPGVSEGALESGGVTRRFLIYAPESLGSSQPVPVVFSLHGMASNARQQMAISGWNGIADDGGFLVIYPQALGAPSRWDAGYFAARSTDDVAFLRALADHVTAAYCADPSRLFVNGMSNGGGMTYRLACEASDIFAAFGGVAGAYAAQLPCQPARPASFMFFHGTADPIVPYEGAGLLANLPEFVAGWAEQDGCDTAPAPLPVTGDVSGLAYSGCAAGAEVTLYIIDEGGHTWPGAPEMIRLLLGRTTQEIDASATLWAFYQKHPLASGE